MPDTCAYPVPPNLVQSNCYRVDVNGVHIWTEHLEVPCDPASPDWFLTNPWVNGVQKIDIASFSGAGAMEVQIAVPEPIRTFRIRPASHNIPSTVSGNTLSLWMNVPGKLVVAINDLPPLFLFDNPPEHDIPAARGAGIRYFGPGEHTPGLMTLDSGETVYLAPGAIVYGGFRNAPGASNVAVRGRGILDGSRLSGKKMVEWTGVSNLTVEGITTRCGHTWQNTLWDCTNATYRNVKVLSFGFCGDGVDPCRCSNVLIQDSLLRCTDDCIAIKSHRGLGTTHGITVDGCILYGHANSDGVTVGYELTTPDVQSILIKNCDVLETRGGNVNNTTHSAFSVICDGAAHVHDLRIEDCRVEEDMLCLFDLCITRGNLYVKSTPGHISDVYLKNVQWGSVRPIRLHGHNAGHLVERVTFDGCSVAGRLLRSMEDVPFEVNEFVREVRFL